MIFFLQSDVIQNTDLYKNMFKKWQKAKADTKYFQGT